MSSISREDYLKLLEEISREEDSGCDNIPDEAWFPSESPAKNRMKNVNSHGVFNITHLKKAEIKEKIFKYTNFQIGNFLIRTKKYRGTPDTDKNINLTFDIEVYERKNQTPTGRQCNMDYRANLKIDDRFATRPWIDLFDDEGRANNISIDDFVNIIRYMQTIKKLSAFL